MITFACRGCGKTFMVPDEFAGRSAKCKQCGGAVTVPALRGREPALAGSASRQGDAMAMVDPDIAVHPVAPAGASAPQSVADTPPPSPLPGVPKKLPMRLRRLTADAEEMRRVFANSPFVRVLEMTGDPPELYRVEYTVRGLVPGKGKGGQGGQPLPGEKHIAQIQLTAEYPRSSPTCKMLSPSFHPNIDAAGICVGDHWTAGERLSDLIVRIGEMIAYQAYNIRSPLNAEAAMWADLHQAELPVDPRDLHPHID